MRYASKGLIRIKGSVLIVRSLLILQTAALRRKSLLKQLTWIIVLFVVIPFILLSFPLVINKLRVQDLPTVFSFSMQQTEKKNLFHKAKEKMQKMFTPCTSWLHNSSDCKSRKVHCNTCNYSHVKGICALQLLVSCASIGTKMTKLCVQDIPINSNSRFKNGKVSARVLFDSGS